MIVVLDGYCLNPGDLNWTRLQALGETMVYERTGAEQVIERARRAEILLTNKVALTAETMACLPSLRYIGVMATGYNIVDVGAAILKNIVVTNVPAYGTDSVAQMTFALLLELCNQVGKHAAWVREGGWSRSPDWSFTCAPLTELAGKTMGIVGYGRIGRRVGELARAFGMKLVVTGGQPKCDVAWAGFEELLQKADVVSLHCPLSPQTHHMINKKALARMKPSSFLLNTSRGGLIVEEDLTSALCGGQLAGAGLDVLALEPPIYGSPLLTAPRCFITPHIGWATREARTRLLDAVVENVAAFICGRPQNVVSPA